MADYPSEDKQEELIEEFKEKYPNKFAWGQANSGIITDYFESPWQDAVAAVLAAGNSDSAQYQALVNIVKVENGFSEDQVSEIKFSRTTTNRDGIGFTYTHLDKLDDYARADVEGYKEDAPFTDILEYEYERAQMNHVFEAEGGVGQVLTDNLRPIVGEFAECARIYAEQAEILMLGIDEFWKNEAVNNMFEDGFDASALRSTIVNPGQVPNPAIDRSSWSGVTTGNLIESIFGDSLPNEYGKTTMSWRTGEPLPDGTPAGLQTSPEAANFDNSELLMANLAFDQESLLKYPERIQTDVDGNYLDPSGDPIATENLQNFPFYWAGMAINFVRIATFVASRAPTTAELASLQSGDADNAWTSISNKNHGGLTNQDFYDIGYRNSPHAVFNHGNAYLLPRNSVAVANLGRPPGDRLFNSALALSTEKVKLSHFYSSATDALRKISNISDGQKIALKLGQLFDVLQEIQAASDCILKNAKAAADEFKAAEEALGELADNGFLGTGFFKDRSLNAAIDAAKAALDDITPAAFIDRGAERVLFREQCFLLSFVATIAGHKKNYLDNVVGGVPQAGSTHKKLAYSQTGFPLSSGPVPETPGQYNASLQVDGDPYGFMNKLTQSPNYGAFFDIDNWMLSYLQPKIRLFKVEYDEDGKETEVELKFESHFSSDEMNLFMDSKSRGVGVGLKSFTFTYDGSNPFSAKKSIKANLKIFANSFNELFVLRKGKATGITEDGTPIHLDQLSDYKFADLALKTFSKNKVNPAELSEFQKRINPEDNKSKLNFRLKAVVGWSEPKHGTVGSPSDPSYTNTDIKNAIKESFVTLNLTPTIHTFDFDDQGRVVMDINYLAYVEDFFDERAYNVFADPSGELGMNRVKRELEAKKHTRECAKSQSEELNDLKREYAEIAGKEKRQAVQSIINSLADQGRIHYVALPLESVRRFTSMGPFALYEDLVPKDEFNVGTSAISIVTSNEQAQRSNERVQQAISEAEAARTSEGFSTDGDFINKLRSSLIAIDPEEHYLTFFYLSDLVDVILANIEKELAYLKENVPVELRKPEVILKVDRGDVKEKIADIEKYLKNFQRLRILLGPIELANPISDTGAFQTTFVNFGDLPISVRYFAEFLASKTLKNDNTVYSLPRFLNDLFNTLVNNFLNSKTCFNFDISQKVRVNQNILTSYAYQYRGGKTKDDITTLLEKKAKSLKEGKRGSPSRLLLSDVDNYPIINISGIAGGDQEYAPLSHEINYFVFFAARTQPSDLMKGRKFAWKNPITGVEMPGDHDRGIFHYMLGKNSGIVKNIKLQKTQTPGLQEVRFEQEGYDGLEQLRVVYDVEIDCYANINAFPGTYIYIPPQGFDPSAGMDMTKFGIGGYYMIYRSSHNFAAGEASTKIYAKWVAQIESEARQDELNNSTSISEVSKCRLQRRGDPDGSGS
jgi:hypothetical protein